MQSVETMQFPIPSWVYEFIVPYMQTEHCFTTKTANVFLHRHHFLNRKELLQSVIHKKSIILATYAIYVQKKMCQQNVPFPPPEIYHKRDIRKTCCPNFSFCGNMDEAYMMRLYGGCCMTCSIYIGQLFIVRASNPLGICSVCECTDHCLVRVQCKKHRLMCMNCLQQPWLYKGFRDVHQNNHRVRHVHGMLQMMSKGGCLHRFLFDIFSEKVHSLSINQQKLLWVQMDLLQNCAICRYEKQFHEYKEQVHKQLAPCKRRNST